MRETKAAMLAERSCDVLEETSMHIRLIMSDKEIVFRYRDMNPEVNRVRILAELNAASPACIEDILRRNGVKLPPKRIGSRGRPLKVDTEQAMRLYKAGMSDQQIAQDLGCSASTIKNWRNRHGIPPQNRKEAAP